MAKISKSYILTPPHPQGHMMSVKCEEPIDELTVQVWLLYHYPNFKYCTLFASGTELRTDRQTDKQTDDPITRCPRRTISGRGHKKIITVMSSGGWVATMTWRLMYIRFLSNPNILLNHFVRLSSPSIIFKVIVWSYKLSPSFLASGIEFGCI